MPIAIRTDVCARCEAYHSPLPPPDAVVHLGPQPGTCCGRCHQVLTRGRQASREEILSHRARCRWAQRR